MDDDHCYRAMQSKDPRFDGWFFIGVTTTGIFCRPSCPATTPKRENVRFYPSAAAAQAAGFRVCKRCQPDASPDSPEWDVRADTVGRAMRLITDGAVDRDGVHGLAARLGYSQRQLHRLLVAEVGAGPMALARAQRARTARVLLETTGLPVSDVAFAAGFASIRQFNDTVRQVFALSPSQLRTRALRRSEPVVPGTISLRLPYRPPLELAGLFGFLADRAVPGVEDYAGDTYRRVLRLPHSDGVVALSPGEGGSYVRCRLRLEDLRDLNTAVARCRRLLDLDADPVAVDDFLAGDETLRPLVAASPGRRVPGAADPEELAVRAVFGQQVSVAGARTVAGRLAARYGKPLTAPSGGLTHAFPSAADLAQADPDDLPMPAARRRALLGLTGALATGDLRLDTGADRDEAARQLLASPGIGPWTVSYIRMRALGDPDMFMPTDWSVSGTRRTRQPPLRSPSRGVPGGRTHCNTCGPYASNPRTMPCILHTTPAVPQRRTRRNDHR